MVEVTMSQKNEIKDICTDIFMSRNGIIARKFGMKTRINGKAKGTQLEKGAIRSYSSVWIEVGKFHDSDGGVEESIGTSNRNGSMHTCTFSPESITP